MEEHVNPMYSLTHWPDSLVNNEGPFNYEQQCEIEDMISFHLYSSEYKKRLISISSRIALKKMKILESSVNLLLLSRDNGGGRKSIFELSRLDLLVLVICLIVGINIGFFFGRFGK